MNKEQKLLINILYYGFFKKKTFFLSPSKYDKLKEVVPKKCFGVFSTIRRHKQLSTWPKNVHGCIGYWDNNYNILSKEQILNHSLRVTYDAIHTDDRRQYFGPLENDPYSSLEIDFLMKPLYKINPINGMFKYKKTIKLFNNDTFGIIVEGPTPQQRATFLPRVFNNKKWSFILKSLLKKGKINNNDHYNLYAYGMIQYKIQLVDLFYYKDFFKYSIQSFIDLLFSFVEENKKYPFFYSYNNSKILFDDKQDVRNCALIGSLFQMNKNKIIILSRDKIKLLKNKASYLLNNMEQLSSQALSFLSPFISYNKSIKTHFCKKLKKDLPHADENFAKPEILIGLKMADCTIFPYKKLSKEINCKLEDSIFKFNWVIQTYYFLYKKIPINLLKLFESKIEDIILKREDKETNFLAVATESICYVFDYTNKKKWLVLLFPIFIELEKRKSCYSLLYAFHNKTCRVDISDHIYSGLSLLT